VLTLYIHCMLKLPNEIYINIFNYLHFTDIFMVKFSCNIFLNILKKLKYWDKIKLDKYQINTNNSETFFNNIMYASKKYCIYCKEKVFTDYCMTISGCIFDIKCDSCKKDCDCSNGIPVILYHTNCVSKYLKSKHSSVKTLRCFFCSKTHMCICGKLLV